MACTTLDASEEFLDVLTELVNIGVGRAAASLSDLIASPIELTVPSIRLSPATDDLTLDAAGVDETSLVVMQTFSGAVTGRSALVFPKSSGLTLAAVLSGVGTVESELDVELTGVLLEVGNILLNSVMGTIANQAGTPLGYTLPALYAGPDSWARLLREDGRGSADLLVVDVHFRVRDREISGSVVIAFAYGSVLELAQSLQSDRAA